MGLIQIENMEFYAYHGHYKEERVIGNRFLVNLEIETNMDVPVKTDQLNDAVNYQQAYNLVKKEMQIKSHLLENIAQRIVDSMYANFEHIEKVTVKVSKMNPPMGGKIEKVSVTISKWKLIMES